MEGRKRFSGAGSVIGLIALLSFGFLIVSAGIAYLALPDSSQNAAVALPTAAPPSETPVDAERPKSLQELLGNDGGQPAAANPPANNGMQPGIPVPHPPKFGPRFK